MEIIWEWEAELIVNWAEGNEGATQRRVADGGQGGGGDQEEDAGTSQGRGW